MGLISFIYWLSIESQRSILYDAHHKSGPRHNRPDPDCPCMRHRCTPRQFSSLGRYYRLQNSAPLFGQCEQRTEGVSRLLHSLKEKELTLPGAKPISLKLWSTKFEITRQLIDFHHRISGFKAVREIFLNDLHRKLRSEFLGVPAGAVV